MATGTRYGVEIRAAVPADAADIALLLRQLGHETTPHGAAGRLDALRRDPDSAVLVAAGYGPVIGLVAVHWWGVLQQARPVARITALAVDEAERRRGIGRLLVKSGAQAARVAGCDLLELTTAPDREDAQAFCRSIGFAPSALGFSRALRKKPPGA